MCTVEVRHTTDVTCSPADLDLRCILSCPCAQVYSLAKPGTPLHSGYAKLTRQTTSVACFPDGSGFLEGSTEGRVAVNYLSPEQRSREFSFKAHRCAVHRLHQQRLICMCVDPLLVPAKPQG